VLVCRLIDSSLTDGVAPMPLAEFAETPRFA
jgi:hypothetical protein